MRTIIISLLIVFAMSACEKQNPFFEKWDNPYEVPPFDKITVADYRNAFIKGMKDQEAEIEAIVNNQETPSFRNTIVAFDASGLLLTQVAAVFFEHASANGTPEVLALESEITPLLTQHSDKIRMNPKLFEKINFVKENVDYSTLTPEETTLLKQLHLDFVRNGAMLDEKNGTRLKEINEKLSVLENQFSQNLLEETGSYRLVIDNEEDLAGLSENIILLAANRAEKAGMPGKWLFGLDNPSIMPFLSYSDKPELRKEIFTAYLNRCNNNNRFDNKEILKTIVVLRKEKANILGYNDFTDYVLEKRMAKNAANIYELLNRVWTSAIEKVKEEHDEMQALIGEGSDLIHSDWRYYAEKVKAKKYDFSDELVRPYFKAENVRDGLFHTYKLLYGITFKELTDIPKPNKDAQAFVCIDKDGVTELGVLYLDLYARPGLKRGGAWCGTYREAFQNSEGQRVKPITYITCNFTPPVGDEPALLTSDEVETLYHESGHAMHNLFRNVKYHLTSEVPYDFVEFPSQFMEHWAFEPQVLAYYAKHYKTGEIIPKDLVDKIQAASKQGQGFATTEYLAASFLDMDYHRDSVPENINVLEFEENTLKGRGLIPQIPPRYRSTYFQHVFTNSYAAGYYCYLWSEVLDCDAFEAFVESGDIFNQAIAEKYRKNILEPGGIYPADEMYVNFRGRQPKIAALLKKRGFTDPFRIHMDAIVENDVLPYSCILTPIDNNSLVPVNLFYVKDTLYSIVCQAFDLAELDSEESYEESIEKHANELLGRRKDSIIDNYKVTELETYEGYGFGRRFDYTNDKSNKPSKFPVIDIYLKAIIDKQAVVPYGCILTPIDNSLAPVNLFYVKDTLNSIVCQAFDLAKLEHAYYLDGVGHQGNIEKHAKELLGTRKDSIIDNYKVTKLRIGYRHY